MASSMQHSSPAYPSLSEYVLDAGVLRCSYQKATKSIITTYGLRMYISSQRLNASFMVRTALTRTKKRSHFTLSVFEHKKVKGARRYARHADAMCLCCCEVDPVKARTAHRLAPRHPTTCDDNYFIMQGCLVPLYTLLNASAHRTQGAGRCCSV